MAFRKIPCSEHEARALYLSMGTNRSITAVAEALQKKYGEGIPSVPTVERWCAKGRWRALAEEHDGRISHAAAAIIERKQAKTAAAAIAKEIGGEGIPTKAWVTAKLQSVVNRCMQAEPVKDAEGNPIGEYKFNAGGANKALELLGKELGMFVERREVGRTGEFTGMDEDELREFVTREADALGVGVQRVEAPGASRAPERKPH